MNDRNEDCRQSESHGQNSGSIGRLFNSIGCEDKHGSPRSIRVVELFAGIGGFRLGLENANQSSNKTQIGQSTARLQQLKQRIRPNGDFSVCSELREQRQTNSAFRVIWANEWDKYAAAIYRKNFGEKELIEGDIRQIKADDIPDHDLLVGGFPCQPFSLAGQRKGFEDIRGTLFFEIARILQAKRPPLFLLENVDGLRSHNNGDTFETIVRTLDELGYNVEWKVLNSKYFGVPQNRERIFFIGCLRERGQPQIYPIESDDGAAIAKGQCVGTLTGGGHSGGLHSDMTGIVMNTVRSGGRGRGSLDRHSWDIVIQDRTQSDEVRVFEKTCPTLASKMGVGGNNVPMVAKACLTPDRPEKRQNGRRFKEINEPMFTLTGQDVHGVCILDTRQQGETRVYNDIAPTVLGRDYKDPLMIANTVRAEHHNSDNAPMVKEKGLIRRLTPNECGYLQGFPKNYAKIGTTPPYSLADLKTKKAIKPNLKTKILRTIHVLKYNEVLIADQQQYKCFGNAVTVNVIQELGEMILDWCNENPEALD